MPSGRDIKRRILSHLEEANWESCLEEILSLPGQQAVGALFSALCNASSAIRWHAVTAFGLVVGAMAFSAPEKARIIMRRFIWSLNDESGGIGWGAPEAMAEIMTQSALIAAEYHNHLLAYIHEDHCRPDCYLEHAPLRRGAIWGVARLSQVRPELTRAAEADLLCALQDCDGTIRGLAAWACGTLKLSAALPLLLDMDEDTVRVEIYRDRHLFEFTPATLAGEAISRITGHPPAKK